MKEQTRNLLRIGPSGKRDLISSSCFKNVPGPEPECSRLNSPSVLRTPSAVAVPLGCLNLNIEGDNGKGSRDSISC